ncbi:MAG: hypothetical protein AAFN81_26005 [Bacteroidota bacterium]
MLQYLFLSLGLFSSLVQTVHAQTDTFSVFHHNYLVERQADLMVFAQELRAYAETHAVSRDLQKHVVKYQQSIEAIDVWKSRDVVATMHELNRLQTRGAFLHEAVARGVEKSQWRKGIRNTIRAVLPYALAILAFPIVYHLLFRRR